MKDLKIAVLGMGIMGSAMARNLIKAGFNVTVWNRDSAKSAPLEQAGARVASSAAEAVAQKDVILTMLHSQDAVLEVMKEAAPAAQPGSLWLQMSTVDLAAVTDIDQLAQEHELVLFDAPVSGTREPAEAGQLLVIAAGPESHRETACRVFDVVGARTMWTSADAASGASTALKLVVNAWVVLAANASGEILALAQALGVDIQNFIDLIAGGGLDNGFMRHKLGLALQEKTAPASFAAETAAKDAHLMVQAASAHGVKLDAIEAAARRLDLVSQQGRGRDDLAVAYYASFNR